MSANPVPFGIELPILHIDEQIVAVHKPAGLLVHPGRIAAGEGVCAMKLLRNRLGRWVYPVHRLDRPTSGVLLFALSPESAARLGTQFRSGTVVKTYLAVVRGWPAPGGIIDHPLKEIRDPAIPRSSNGDKPSKPAVTVYRTLATAEIPRRVDRYPTSRYALVEACPETGRRHQLRRHLKHLSHPIIGDTTWGKSRHNRLFTELYGSERLLLAAVRLKFDHPETGLSMEISATPAPDFQRVVDAVFPPFVSSIHQAKA